MSWVAVAADFVSAGEKGLVVAWLSVVVLASYFAWTAARHKRYLKAVPIRIHVAGTRGKSSTVRLIAAGLRAQGLTVLAKTTGTLPRLILPSGQEEAWPRRGPASIREQLRFARLAARGRVDATVVECMAIKPELVWAMEHYLVKSTIAVITNARRDHGEEIRGGEAATALSQVIPRRALLVLSDEAAVEPIVGLANGLGTRIEVVSTRGLKALEMNDALATAVCIAAGVPGVVARRGLALTTPDPGAFSISRVAVGGVVFEFANAFACNDARSLQLLWDETYAGKAKGVGNDEGGPGAVRTSLNATPVLLNLRSDRPLRTIEFIRFLAEQGRPVMLFLSADRAATANRGARLARRAGGSLVGVQQLEAGTRWDTDRALEQMANAAGNGGMAWGVGNFRGPGEQIIAAVQKRSLPC